MAESGEIVWSLGCDVTIEDFDSSIEEIKVGDISLSGVVSVGELPVDVDSDRVNVMDLDVSFSVDGVHSTIIESQVVPHARIVDIGSYSPEATNEKRYAASAYAAKKILDSLTETNNKVSKNENAIDNLQTAVNELEKKVDEGGTGTGDSHWYLSSDGKIHTDYDIVVHGNAIIEGDTASGGAGEDITVGLDEQAVLDLLEREKYVTEDDIAGLVPEVDLSDYYKATQVDDLLSKKANTQDVYTKEELNPYKAWWDKVMSHLTVDENGNVTIDTNLIVSGDTASGGEGENNPVGIQGIKLNGQTYTDYDGDGVIDLGELGGGDLDIDTLEAYLTNNKYITESALNGYATQQWVNNQGFAKASAIPTLKSLMGGSAIGGTTSYIYWNGSAWATKTLGDRAFDSTAYQPLATAINTGNIGSYAPIYNASGNVTIGSSDLAGTSAKLSVDGSFTMWGAYQNVMPTLGDFTNARFKLYGYGNKKTQNWGLFAAAMNTGNVYLQAGGDFGDTLAYSLLLNPLGGNVGIRTTSPLSEFQVDGQINLSAGTNNNYSFIRSENYSSNISLLRIGTCYGYSSEAVAMTIYKGMVKIGKAIPTCALDVNGDSKISGNLVVSGDVASGGEGQETTGYLPLSGGVLTGAGDNIQHVITIDTTNNLLSDIRVRIQGEYVAAFGYSKSTSFGGYRRGAFLYNGVTPASLNVRDDGIAYFNDYTLIHSGNISQYTGGSDIRYKSKVRDVSIDIEDIVNAPFFDFYWTREDMDKDIHAGTSAQYWEVKYPSLVSGVDFRSLNYGALAIGGLISIAKKVKELEAKIKYMEERYGEVC